ncbi:MAG: protein kinase [Myxococcota bacterium]
MERQFAVLGPLQSGVPTRAFLGVEVVDGESVPERPVVVVWLPDDLVSDGARLARLQLETELVRQLRHPNIIDVHGLIAFEEGWARVVQFVDGEPLSRVMKEVRTQERSFETTLVARVILDICRGVAHAHEEGMRRFHGHPIVHGGIRPDTILLGFEGAASVTGYAASALAPSIEGRPLKDNIRYFAPEQILGGQTTASPATDVYMIGAVLYELLGKRPPFADESDIERAVLEVEPPALALKGVAGGLESVALRALAKRGSERFKTVEDMAQAIREVLKRDDVDLPQPAEIATFVDSLIPKDAPERVGRRDLLATASDMDSLTLLTPKSRRRVSLEQTVVQPSPAPRAAIDAVLPSFEDALPPFKTSPLDGESPLPAQDGDTDDTIAEHGGPSDSQVDGASATRSAPKREPDTVLDDVSSSSADSTAPGLDAREQDSKNQAGLGSADIDQDIADDERITHGRIPVDDLLTSGVQEPSEDQALTDRVPVPQPGPAPSEDETASPELAAARESSESSASPQNVLPPPQYYPVYPAPGAYPPPPGAYPAYPHPYAPGVAYPGYGPIYPTGVVMTAGRPAPQPPRVQMRANPGQTVTDPRLINAPVQGLAAPVAPKRSSPIRDASVSITHFNRRAGDGSRSLFVWVLAFAIGLLAFIFLFPKEPPKGLDQPSSRTRLPPELVREALSRRAGGTAIVEANAIMSSTMTGSKDEASLRPLTAPAGSLTEAGALLGDLEASSPQSDVSQTDGSTKAAAAVAEDTAFRETVVMSDSPQPALVEPRSLRSAAVPLGGIVKIDSDPEVKVFIGDRSYGRTPIKARLPDGRHRVRLTDAETGINAYRYVRVRSGRVTSASFDFGTCELDVDAPEGAVVKLNARVLGTAPLASQTIYEGRYLLRVSYLGAVWSERFDAPAGGRLTYTVRLKDAPR